MRLAHNPAIKENNAIAPDSNKTGLASGNHENSTFIAANAKIVDAQNAICLAIINTPRYYLKLWPPHSKNSLASHQLACKRLCRLGGML